MTKPFEQMRICPKHLQTRYDAAYWRGCPECHPVIAFEDIADRLASDISHPTNAVLEILALLIRAMGSSEPLRRVTNEVGEGCTRHNKGAINGEPTRPPKRLDEENIGTGIALPHLQGSGVSVLCAECGKLIKLLDTERHVRRAENAGPSDCKTCGLPR